MKTFFTKKTSAENKNGEQVRTESQLRERYTMNCSNKSSEWEKIWINAQKVIKYTIDALHGKWRDWLAWMTDLEKIGIHEIRKIKEEDEGRIISINGFKYCITEIKDRARMPDGNYYDPRTKNFVVKNNKLDNLLEYSPYRKYEKISEISTWEIFWRDDLLIKWFVWKIWDVLSDKMNNDPETGMLLDYSSEYEGMIWWYDIGIWYFEWEIKNKYGSETYVWFEGNWIFRLDNGVILSWNFGIEYYLDTKKIFWSWKIRYPDGKEEIWSRGGEWGLYEKIYPEDDS